VNNKLSVEDHSRDAAGLVYVYPVLSRRAGGISIGINLNPNNACNWRCIYCQVPNLVRGASPPIDLVLFRSELDGFLKDILQGDFFHRFNIAPAQRVIRDIAISGNGEATSSEMLEDVIKIIGELIANYGLAKTIKKILISNGSLMHLPRVESALRSFNSLGGEVWFKLDQADDEGIKTVNNASISIQKVVDNLHTCRNIVPTWIQTCVFQYRGQSMTTEQQAAFVELLRSTTIQGKPLRGVLLYGLARPSMQPEAEQLSNADTQWIISFAEQIRTLGLELKISD